MYKKAEAQAPVVALAAIADPFQKFVHDVIDFGKFIIERKDRIEREKRADSVPKLAMALHRLAAEKREFARQIRMGLNQGYSPDLYAHLHIVGADIELVISEINAIDPHWAKQHNETEIALADITQGKMAAMREGLRIDIGGPQGLLIASDAEKFAANLDMLAAKLDSIANEINQSFVTH